MVHKGDVKIVAQMLRNIEKSKGSVDFSAPLVVAAPTYNIIDELKAEGDWDILQKYSGVFKSIAQIYLLVAVKTLFIFYSLSQLFLLFF